MSSIIDLVSDSDSVIDLCSDSSDSSDSDVEYINVDQVQAGYVSDADMEEFVNLFGVHQDNHQHLPPLDQGFMDELALVEELGLLPPLEEQGFTGAAAASAGAEDLPTLEEAVVDYNFDFDAYFKPPTVAEYSGRSQKRGIQLTERYARALKRQKK